MHIYPKSIGEFNPNGTIKTEAENCALTGVPVLNEHHTVQVLGDSPYFVRVVSQRAKQLTDDVQADLLASVQPPPKSVRAKAADAAKED